jgi:predicted MFS family arabinose efflux permease
MSGCGECRTQAPPVPGTVWLGVGACLCTTILGLGLARFAYTPMIPALVGAHWFTASQAVYLGAANLAGYLLGALAAAPLARRLGVRACLRAAMIAATASLYACVVQAGFAWFFAWRTLSGVAGAVLVVLAAPSVLPLLPARVRGRAGGVIFLGIGLGMAGSGTLLPVLLRHGVREAWAGLALAGTLMTLAAWAFLPPDAPRDAAGRKADGGAHAALGALLAAYAANAVGQIPAILFLTEYVAHHLGQGVQAGAAIWALVGLGALIGPVGAGALADRIGFANALRLLWLSQVAAYLVLALCPVMAAVTPASIVAGAGVPAAVVLVFGRSQVLAAPEADARRRAWSLATSAFALAQAVGGYALSYALSFTGRYDLLFGLGALLMLLALLLTEVSYRLARR